MIKTLALIHTSPTLTPLFSDLCAKVMPEANTFHMVDESLIKDTIREGKLRRVTIRRLLATIQSAELAGADAVVVTCSSIGAGVAIAQKIFDIPVIRIDEAMAEAAIRTGRRIGVMATLTTTLEPTIALLKEKAQEAGLDIEIVESLCEGAFEAVQAGDAATHDHILTEALKNDMKDVDVIVLAQASMAGVIQRMPLKMVTVPILSSPELAIIKACEALAGLHRPEAHSTSGEFRKAHC